MSFVECYFLAPFEDNVFTRCKLFVDMLVSPEILFKLCCWQNLDLFIIHLLFRLGEQSFIFHLGTWLEFTSFRLCDVLCVLSTDHKTRMRSCFGILGMLSLCFQFQAVPQVFCKLHTKVLKVNGWVTVPTLRIIQNGKQSPLDHYSGRIPSKAWTSSCTLEVLLRLTIMGLHWCDAAVSN